MKLRVAICGIDGAGKSTLAENLVSVFSSHKIPVIYAKVPFPSKEVCAIAKIDGEDVVQKIIKRTGMAFDFVRYYSTFEKFNGILICDRYDVDYEILNRVYELPQKYLCYMHSIYNVVPSVDLYIYLKISAEVAARRLEARGDRACDESDLILKNMAKEFDIIMHKQNVFLIDALQSTETITKLAESKIIELWEKVHDCQE